MDGPFHMVREEARNADGVLIVAERAPTPWTSLPEPAVAPVGWARPTLTGLRSVVVPLVRPAAERNGHRSHHPLFPPRVSLGWLHRLIGVVMVLTSLLRVWSDVLAWIRILLM